MLTGQGRSSPAVVSVSSFDSVGPIRARSPTSSSSTPLSLESAWRASSANNTTPPDNKEFFGSASPVDTTTGVSPQGFRSPQPSTAGNDLFVQARQPSTCCSVTASPVAFAVATAPCSEAQRVEAVPPAQAGSTASPAQPPWMPAPISLAAVGSPFVRRGLSRFLDEPMTEMLLTPRAPSSARRRARYGAGCEENATPVVKYDYEEVPASNNKAYAARGWSREGSEGSDTNDGVCGSVYDLRVEIPASGGGGGRGRATSHDDRDATSTPNAQQVFYRLKNKPHHMTDDREKITGTPGPSVLDEFLQWKANVMTPEALSRGLSSVKSPLRRYSASESPLRSPAPSPVSITGARRSSAFVLSPRGGSFAAMSPVSEVKRTSHLRSGSDADTTTADQLASATRRHTNTADPSWRVHEHSPRATTAARSASTSSSSTEGSEGEEDVGSRMVEAHEHTAAICPPRPPAEVTLLGRRSPLTDDELRVVGVFAPSLVLELVLQEEHEGAFAYEMEDTVVMVVDLAGFTKLCESCASGDVKLAKFSKSVDLSTQDVTCASAEGSKLYRMSNDAEVEGMGAEGVRELLNHYFGVLLDVVYEHGGDVVRIAGDALICVFYDDICGSVKLPSGLSHGLLRLMQRVLGCAEACISSVNSNRAPDVPLDVHVGVGYGTVRCCQIGSDEFGWQLLIFGAPLQQVGEALEVSKAGECVVSDAMWQQMEPCVGELCVEVVACRDGMHKVRGRRGMSDKCTQRAELLATLKDAGLPERSKHKLLGFTPILEHVGVLEEATGLQSEIRTLTVMFILIDHKDLQEAAGDDVMFQTISEAFEFAQMTIVQHEGLIKELSVDDKGLVLVAAFGLTAVMRRNFASQACKCALELAFGLNIMHLGAHVGLATGRVSCASIGSRLRREFALVSDTVNVSARLMVLGKTSAEHKLTLEYLRSVDCERAEELSGVECSVLVDEYTRRRAMLCPRTSFHRCSPAAVKGKKRKLEVFMPRMLDTTTYANEDIQMAHKAEMDSMPYETFQGLIADMLGCSSVEAQLETIVWVRCEGKRSYLRLLVDHMRSLNLGSSEGGIYHLKVDDFSSMQAVASVVPDELQEAFSQRLSCLPRSYIIVLKIMAIVGEGSVEIVLYLFEHQSSLARYWGAHRHASQSREELCSPRSADVADSPQAFNKREFIAVMLALGRHGFIDYDRSTQTYRLREPLLVEHLYTSIPFRQRIVLHGFTAEWLLDSSRADASSVADMYPLIVHHYNMAFREARSATIMQTIQTKAPKWMTEWVQSRLAKLPGLGDATRRYRSTSHVMERTMSCLVAYPWLRGLSRMLYVNKDAPTH